MIRKTLTILSLVGLVVPRALACLLVITLLSILQTGCVTGSASHFQQIEQDPDTVPWFKVDLDGACFHGYLMQSISLVGLPTPLVLANGHNPFHLTLQKCQDSRDVRVTHVSIKDDDGRILFDSEETDRLLTGESHLESAEGHVFSKNPLWEPYRRTSSREGWEHSVPVTVPRRCKKVLLEVRYDRPRDAGALVNAQGSVELKRSTTRGTGILTDSVFQLTGSMIPHPTEDWR